MSTQKTIRNGITSAFIFLQVLAFPTLALAQEAASEATPQQVTSASAPEAEPTTDSSPQASVVAPVYTHNPDGTWGNGTYTWDPETHQSSLNTDRQDTTDDAAHEPTTKARAAAAASPSSTTPQPVARSAANIASTGPSSANATTGVSNTNGTFDLFSNGAISNTVNSAATSGNALVQSNTSAGDSISGNASAVANLLNMLQSSWLGGQNMVTFVQNIDGNVYGDLLIDPSKLPASSGFNNSNIDLNVSNNGAINNNVNLAVTSGNATVDSNTKAGNAITGSAQAVANIINMINSSITSGQSFLGMININGNYNGDILLPPGVLQAVLSNTGTNSTNTLGGTTNSSSDLSSNINRTINNNVNATAASGNALVRNNTSAGNAVSGAANSSVNTINLAGQNIAGKNGVLVFVNLLGTWVGMVVGPAPTTATISTTGPASTNAIGPSTSNQTLTVTADENSLINNNIVVTAASGDATVSNNTQAGNATTGNANSSVNLLNMIGSDINMSDFFGVLFINVFGSWFGNFGADSANGGFSQSPPAASNPTTVTTQANNSYTSVSINTPSGNVFEFISGTGTPATSGQASTSNEQPAQTNAVLASSTGVGTPTGQGAGGNTSNVSGPQLNWWLIAGIIGAITTLLVLIREYVLAVRAENQQ